MRKLSILSLITAFTALTFVSQTGAVTVQSPLGFEGRKFLWLEAESYSSLGEDLDNNGWVGVNKDTPIVSVGGLDILPADSNVHGTALLDQIGGGQHADTAVYEVMFRTAGTYQFYSRHTMYDSNGNGSFSNEDSIFVSPAFDKNSSSDWVGFNGLEFDENDIDVDIPNPGFALDPNGFKPSVGDTEKEGWHAIRDWRIKSQGAILGSGSQDPSRQNGKFHWYNRPAYVGSGPGGGFNTDFGMKTEFIVTPEQVGQVVTFEIASREQYGVFDGFLFIQDDDVDLLDVYTQEEVDGIFDIPVGSIADLNLDGYVDGLDLGVLLGDWNPPTQPSGSVPEPTSALMLLLGACGVLGLRKQG
ncbi:MAG: PEP-CTERM sorting domain-containing protein [Pirellulales bacterium]